MVFLEEIHINKIIFQAYSPLGSRDRPWAKENEREVLNEPLLETLAKKYGKTPAQIVLRWHVQRGISVVPKSVHSERIEENYDIWGFNLSSEDMLDFDNLNIGYRYVLWPSSSEHADYPFKDELPYNYEVETAPKSTTSSSR